MMKKSIFLTVTFCLSCSLLLSQSLVEAAKKEKERRAQLKKKSAVIVTNANLLSPDRKVAPIKPPSKAKPQPAQRATPAKPAPQQRTQQSQSLDSIDQRDLSVDKLDQSDQLQARGFRSDYALQVLSSNEIVRNPEFALHEPDGRYAELPIYGFIELEISAINRQGDDIAIYAQKVGSQEEIQADQEEGGIPELAVGYQYWEGLWYGILGMTDSGEWLSIGQGTGAQSPENFDLGEMKSVKRLRIMFRPHNNADLPFKVETWQSNEFFFKIDAVKSLHR